MPTGLFPLVWLLLIIFQATHAELRSSTPHSIFNPDNSNIAKKQKSKTPNLPPHFYFQCYRAILLPLPG